MWLGYGHFLTSAFDQALFLPSGKEPADRMQRRARHLGDILPRDRKIDEHAFVHPPARLIDKFEESVGDAPVYLFSRHFNDPRMGVLQSAANHLIRVGAKIRKRGGELRPEPTRPGEYHTVDGGDGARRIGRAAECMGNSHQFAWADVAHNYLLPVRRRPDHAHMPIEQQEERMRFSFLLEDSFVLGDAERMGLPNHAVEINRGQALKWRKPGNQRAVETAQVHIPSVICRRPRSKAAMGMSHAQSVAATLSRCDLSALSTICLRCSKVTDEGGLYTSING